MFNIVQSNISISMDERESYQYTIENIIEANKY